MARSTEGSEAIMSVFDGELPTLDEIRESLTEALGGKHISELPATTLAYLSVGSIMTLARKTKAPPYAVAEAMAAALGSPWMLEAMLDDALTELAQRDNSTTAA